MSLRIKFWTLASWGASLTEMLYQKSVGVLFRVFRRWVTQSLKCVIFLFLYYLKLTRSNQHPEEFYVRNLVCSFLTNKELLPRSRSWSYWRFYLFFFIVYLIRFPLRNIELHMTLLCWSSDCVELIDHDWFDTILHGKTLQIKYFLQR